MRDRILFAALDGNGFVYERNYFPEKMQHTDMSLEELREERLKKYEHITFEIY